MHLKGNETGFTKIFTLFFSSSLKYLYYIKVIFLETYKPKNYFHSTSISTEIAFIYTVTIVLDIFSVLKWRIKRDVWF